MENSPPGLAEGVKRTQNINLSPSAASLSANLWITVRMINDKARNDTDLNKCGASSLPRRSAATSSGKKQFPLSERMLRDCVSDEEV